MFKYTHLIAVCAFAAAEKCPSGGEIFERGISEAGKVEVVKAHNDYRLQIANGTVPDQPRGIDLKRMVYDDALGKEGKLVSDTCKMAHVDGSDSRWGWLGQNLYRSQSMDKTSGQDWQRAVKVWFNEHKDFKYPSTSTGTTGHYTQVVWAESDHVGCDFIFYYDNNNPDFPYTKLYTCNYGPGGNSEGKAPYKTGTSGCEKLC